ncbi:MAG: FtsK/SpoIIIE domain-containing protein [Planctomycetota bacterium]|jgi:hypothetical protein
MRDHLDDYINDPAPTIEDDHLNLQRSSFRELLKLSAESVRPAESQIECQFEKAVKSAQEKYAESSTTIEGRFRELKESAQKTYDEQVKKVQALYESDSRTLEANTKATREKVVGDYDRIKRDAKKGLDHELWLGETVLGATKKELHKKYRRVEKEVPADNKRLDSVGEQAESLLGEYGHDPQAFAWPASYLDMSAVDDPGSLFSEQFESAEEQLDTLENLTVPRMFIGIRPYFYITLLCGVLVGLMGLLYFLEVSYFSSFFVTGPIGLVLGLTIGLLGYKWLWRISESQVKVTYEPLQQLISDARLTLDRRLELAKQQMEQALLEAVAKRDSEIEKVKERYDLVMAGAKGKRSSSLQQLEESHARLGEEIEHRRDNGLQRAEDERDRSFQDYQERYDRDIFLSRERYDRQMADCQSRYDSSRSLLQRRWEEGLLCIKAFLDDTAGLNGPLFCDWNDPSWGDWCPPDEFTSVVRFGELMVDINLLASSVGMIAPFEAGGLGVVSAPALLAFPERCSLLIQSDRDGLDSAIKSLRAVMLRLVTSLPPGRVRFTIVDPVGLGENFAGFMHLADYDDSLVGGRIWTDSSHIEQRLADLTEHMENVIQKYLRNEFETIDEYNLQAGELAEPYRFLVIANFPVNFNEEAARRLSSILNSGARCGVYTLIVHDVRQELPAGFAVEDLCRGSVHLVYKKGRFEWQDEVFRQFPLELDVPPVEDWLTRVMHIVGAGAKESKRVEVPFETVAPSQDKCWSADSSEDLRIPVGRTGAVRLQHLGLGRGVAQHALIAGKTGSGKSTLLHIIITNLALWYGPDEVELYLVDFKKGVEFKTYVTHGLAHARAVAIESDREFGLSVLQRIDMEMERRGELFRRAGVQDLPSYRKSRGVKLPRTLLIVDEFQVFFSEDDKLAQDAGVLLDRLVRQGRAFGIHVLLGSQTLGGTSGLARSTIGQMAVRVALQCTEADSQLILEDNNTAARLLSRPGEAIYNDAGGLVEGNSPFQTAWLSDDRRDTYLDRVEQMAGKCPERGEPMIVFEGNVPADISKSRLLGGLLEKPEWGGLSTSPRIWLGEAVAIKEPTSVRFRRQSGANLLIVGQRDDAAMAIMAAGMLGLGAQYDPKSVRFYIFDGSPADSPLAGNLQRVASILPHTTRMVGWREVGEVMGELANEVQRRQEADQTDAPAIYLMVYGLHRYRILRRSEDDFGYVSDEVDKPPAADKQFTELLREGPPLGVHTITWCDTPASLERTLDRSSMREFDNRVLFQMSASDSSNLIDSPAANNLGHYRALFYSEEQGLLEKFRPFAFPEESWLEQAKSLLQV